MPITMKLVAAGLPGPAMLKNSSIQVRRRKVATGSTKPRRARGSGNLRPRPKVFWVRCQKVRRWTHSAKPPKGHIAHHARPTTTIITNTRQNQTYQVIAVPKLRPGHDGAEQADEDHRPKDDLVRQDQKELELPVAHRVERCGDSGEGRGPARGPRGRSARRGRRARAGAAAPRRAPDRRGGLLGPAPRAPYAPPYLSVAIHYT